MTNDELLRRADMWLSEFHNKGGVTVPDDSYLAIIRDLASALRAMDTDLRDVEGDVAFQKDEVEMQKNRAERAEAALKDHLVHTQGCPDCLDDAALRLKAERERDEARAERLSDINLAISYLAQMAGFIDEGEYERAQDFARSASESWAQDIYELECIDAALGEGK